MRESDLEEAMLRWINKQLHLWGFKFKDQSKRVNGSYRRNPWEVNGVSDLCVMSQCGRTYWIEVKLPSGVQSDAQKDFQSRVEAFHGRYKMVRSLKELKDYLDNEEAQSGQNDG